MLRGLTAVTSILWLTTLYAFAEELSIGDPAPPLAVKEFVKGEPVKKLEKGKIYVIEFWAINCPPCRAVIPHMTSLQKKYPDVVFIGVNVTSSKKDLLSDIKPFVDKMGDKMDYRVALDGGSVGPNGKDRVTGMMEKTWMEAAGVNGIPHAFIINGDGKIAWIGHPGFMDDLSANEPLKKITTGKWDLAALVKKEKEAAKKEREQGAVVSKERELKEKQEKKFRKNLDQAKKSGDPKKVIAFIEQTIADNPKRESELRNCKWVTLVGMEKDPRSKVAIIDQAIADDPKLEGTFAMDKFRTLIKLADKTDEALDCGKQLIETSSQGGGGSQHKANMVINIAWDVIGLPREAEPKAATINPKLVLLALQAALRADELIKSMKDEYGAVDDDMASDIAETLAYAYFLSGEMTNAVATQERALKLSVRQSETLNLRKRFELYKKAAEKENTPH